MVPALLSVPMVPLFKIPVWLPLIVPLLVSELMEAPILFRIATMFGLLTTAEPVPTPIVPWLSKIPMEPELSIP